MQAEDILTATHKLETSGMTRPQSEAIANTIIAAVAPLATKDDLESMKEQMATKTDLEVMNTKIESTKVWLLTGLLGLTGSLLAVAATIAVYSFRIGVGG